MAISASLLLQGIENRIEAQGGQDRRYCPSSQRLVIRYRGPARVMDVFRLRARQGQGGAEAAICQIFSRVRVANSERNSKVSDYTSRGALGAGLVFLSRFPIMGASAHPYSLNGSPLDVFGGDWFVGKAAVSILLTHPILGQLQVFTTHVSRVKTSPLPAVT